MIKLCPVPTFSIEAERAKNHECYECYECNDSQYNKLTQRCCSEFSAEYGYPSASFIKQRDAHHDEGVHKEMAEDDASSVISYRRGPGRHKGDFRKWCPIKVGGAQTNSNLTIQQTSLLINKQSKKAKTRVPLGHNRDNSLMLLLGWRLRLWFSRLMRHDKIVGSLCGWWARAVFHSRKIVVVFCVLCGFVQNRQNI